MPCSFQWYCSEVEWAKLLFSLSTAYGMFLLVRGSTLKPVEISLLACLFLSCKETSVWEEGFTCWCDVSWSWNCNSSAFQATTIPALNGKSWWLINELLGTIGFCAAETPEEKRKMELSCFKVLEKLHGKIFEIPRNSFQSCSLGCTIGPEF